MAEILCFLCKYLICLLLWPCVEINRLTYLLSHRDAVCLRNLNKTYTVGGAPVTQEFADDMGADGYGKDALACVALAKDLLKKSLITKLRTSSAPSLL